jgi:hypothetical protein
MRPPREYEFAWELSDGSPCVVFARVTNEDHPGNQIDPPEYRDVEIVVFRPLPKDGAPGTPRRLIDITEDQTEDFIFRLQIETLEIEDNAPCGYLKTEEQDWDETDDIWNDHDEEDNDTR